MESFFHSLKVKAVHGEYFADRQAIRSEIFNYIEFDYNKWCHHSACGGLSPNSLKTNTSLRAVSTFGGQDHSADILPVVADYLRPSFLNKLHQHLFCLMAIFYISISGIIVS